MGSTEPFWIEIDLSQFRKNIKIIESDMPKGLRWCSVLKNGAYGHGLIPLAKEIEKSSAHMIAVSTLREALELKQSKIQKPILIFGERSRDELETCIENAFVFFVNDTKQAKVVSEIAKKHGKKVDVQLEIDTGLSRYGVRWTGATEKFRQIADFPNIQVTGVMTHFAMSDELDKSFAEEQIRRFDCCREEIRKINSALFFHASNTGGYLDLPKAHYDMVRMGILPLGIYPSKVCRRIEGLEPIFSFKTKIAAIKKIKEGDVVGYGMHYKALSPRTIAVLPMGYGTGYPRLRNQGHVLVRGKHAPIIGGNAMNAMMIDVSEISDIDVLDEAVLIGSQEKSSITAVDVADWSGTVCYDILTRLGSMCRSYIDAKIVS